MRSTSMITPMLTLPHDVLSVIALRLPAVGSTKPWRDVNSLATTCKGLYQWKKTKVDEDARSEWERVSAEVAQMKGWRDSLEKILSDFEHPSRRLFREPILRKITKAKEPLTTDKPITSVSDFNVSLYKKRETASLDEIRECLIVCTDKKLEKNKKIELVTKLPSFLTELKSIDRQRALRMMFKLLDADKELGLSLKKKGFFKKILASLDDNEPSEALLELGLRTRGLLTSKPDLGNLGINLECIPSAERWDWVLKSVPECLNARIGIQTMLDDPACCTQMMDYLDKTFSESTCKGKKLKICAKISQVHSMLCKSPEGNKLIQKLVDWFLKAPVFVIAKDGPLQSIYVDLLIKYLTLDKIYFENSDKSLFFNKIFNATYQAINTNTFDQSTSLLIALVKNDKEVFRSFGDFFLEKRKINPVSIKEALKIALKRSSELHTSDGLSEYIFFLKKVAHHYFHAHSTFFKEFRTAANDLMKDRSKPKKN